MTPFGQKLRAIRRERGLTLKDMAAALGVSSAYLSALEHGRRGKPTFELIQSLCGAYHIIWDEAEALKRLADLSHPKITLDTSGLSPEATELANRLARDIRDLDGQTLRALLSLLRERP